MTDLNTEVRHNADIANDLIERAHLLTPDAAQQAMALITAATVVIERDVGRALATGVLAALIAPTLADWTDQQPSGTMQ